MRCIFTGSLRASQANTDSACYGPFRISFSLTSRARANLQKSLGMDDSRLSWLNVLLKACSEEWCDGCSLTGSSFAWSAATTPHSVMKTLPAAEFCRKSSLISKWWANPRLHRLAWQPQRMRVHGHPKHVVCKLNGAMGKANLDGLMGERI